MSADSLLVALVTPFAWPVPSAVNQHVADLARELRARGHRPVVLCSSDDLRELQRMRRLSRRPVELGVTLLAAWQPGSPPDQQLLPPEGSGPLRPRDGVPVLPMGRSFPLWVNGSVANIGLPVDVTSRLERLLVGAPFDLVHVHEPVAPSLSFTAIRETRSPVVATFHLTPAGLLAFDVGRSVLARFLGRLDGRIVTSAQAAGVLAESFAGEYRVVPPGAALLPPEGAGAPAPEGAESGPGASVPARPGGEAAGLYIYRGDDSRGFRAFLRALAAVSPGDMDRLVVALHTPSVERWAPRPAPRRLRPRLTWMEYAETADLRPLLAQARFVFLPYLGGEWLVPAVSEALVMGCPVVGPDLPVVRDILRGVPGSRLFDPRREPTLASCLHSLESACRLPGDTEDESQALSATDLAARHTISGVAGEVLGVYQEVMRSTSRRSGASSSARQRTAQRRGGAPADRHEWVYADLHVHTSHSKDCAVPVEAVLATAREVGLGALAIADHNTIDGALEAVALAGGDPIVIVAEEVMTLSGEVMGLFLKEPIPRDLSFEETLSLIKEQGGLVYIPHPFDGLRMTPSYREMVDNLHRIDVIETYNTRNFLASFNLNAERFAQKYSLAAGAGSDSHVLPGLGTAMLRMPRFDGPEEFLAGLREADIVTRRRSLLYLQSLKLLQTTLDRVHPDS